MSLITEIPDDLINILSTYFVDRNDKINRWGNVISSYQSIPGLVGFWSMSSVQRSTGNVYDLSGQSRTMTYAGNPTFNIYNDLVAYCAFDGTADVLSRADETDLDIGGNESIYATSVQGLTAGIWVRTPIVNPGGNMVIYGKGTPGTDAETFALWSTNGSTIQLSVVDSTGAFRDSAPNVELTANTWHFIGLRWDNSANTVASWLDGAALTSNASSRSALSNNAIGVSIGGAITGAALKMTGDIALVFLSANALSGTLINGLFQQSRGLFGV